MLPRANRSCLGIFFIPGSGITCGVLTGMALGCGFKSGGDVCALYISVCLCVCARMCVFYLIDCLCCNECVGVYVHTCVPLCYVSACMCMCLGG